MRWGWMVAMAATTTIGCTHRVDVAYTQAAQINLGKDVQKVIVVERVGAGNTGESVIDFAEGVFTGEGWEGDADATSAAIEGLMDTLRSTNRFDVTDVRVNGRGVDENLFGGTMAPKQVIKMCEKTGCDAIIAVDALDTDTSASISVDRDPDFGTEYDGTANTNLTATFRVYEKDGTLRDESRVRTGASSQVTGADSRAEASQAVAVTPQMQTDLAYSAGVEYAARISPHAVVDSRKLYATGSPEMRQAWDHVRASNWGEAIKLWKEVQKSGDAKDAAKAKYNLAIVKERRGKLDEARTLAKGAAADFTKNRTRDYVAALDARIHNEKRVEKQMGAKGG